MATPLPTPFLPIASLIALLASPALAQIPRGHVVVSSFNNGLPNQGLATFHAYGPSTSIAIAGLPAGITGLGLTTPAGAGSVLVNTATGNVVVGEHAPAGASLDVHVVTLSGTTATSILSYPVGTVGAGMGSTDQMAWLGDDILVLNRRLGLATGPLAGQTLGLVRPSFGPPGTPGTVIALPLTSLLGGTVNAMALDAVGAAAYIATFVFNGGVATSSIYRVPVSPPHTPLFVATVPDAVLSLAFDTDGLLVASTGYSLPGSNVLHAVNVVTGAIVASSGVSWPTTPYSFRSLNTLTCDPTTGDLLFVEDAVAGAFRTPRLGGGAYGTPVGIATGLASAVSGIALRPAVSTYGQGTPGAQTYAWQTVRLSGGQPTIGNAAFQLAMMPTANAVPTILGMGTGVTIPPPLPTSLGFTLLLPATAFAIGLAAQPTSLPLPIPPNQALAGQNFFLQTFHLEPTGFAASNGLWLTPF